MGVDAAVAFACGVASTAGVAPTQSNDPSCNSVFLVPSCENESPWGPSKPEKLEW